MPWTAYKIILQVASPLHVGSQKIGNIQQTRPYVTGRALWGAITARLTRDFFTPPGNYAAVGEQVHNALAFSYFYPALNQGQDVWLRWLKPAQEFDWLFLDTYASTALADGHVAETASLHETEFIAPRTRDNRFVFLVGYIFEKQGNTLPWRNTLDRLQFGSERGYGWGRVKLARPPEASNDCLGFSHDLTESSPKLWIPAESHLPAHTLATAFSNVDGLVEPFLGREWDDKLGGSGRRVSRAQICWSPGSKTQVSFWLRIGNFGVLANPTESR